MEHHNSINLLGVCYRSATHFLWYWLRITFWLLSLPNSWCIFLKDNFNFIKYLQISNRSIVFGIRNRQTYGKTTGHGFESQLFYLQAIWLGQFTYLQYLHLKLKNSYHFTSIRMATITKREKNKCWWGYGKKSNSCALLVGL